SRPWHRVSEISLSAWPAFGLPVMNFPPPSITPPPRNPMFWRLSPQIMASWKWLWPKSWYASFGLGSAASYPLAAPSSVAPDTAATVVLRRTVPITEFPFRADRPRTAPDRDRPGPPRTAPDRPGPAGPGPPRTRPDQASPRPARVQQTGWSWINNVFSRTKVG